MIYTIPQLPSIHHKSPTTSYSTTPTLAIPSTPCSPIIQISLTLQHPYLDLDYTDEDKIMFNMHNCDDRPCKVCGYFKSCAKLPTLYADLHICKKLTTRKNKASPKHFPGNS